MAEGVKIAAHLVEECECYDFDCGGQRRGRSRVNGKERLARSESEGSDFYSGKSFNECPESDGVISEWEEEEERALGVKNEVCDVRGIDPVGKLVNFTNDQQGTMMDQ